MNADQEEHYLGEERRQNVKLTDVQIDEVAGRAADIVVARVQQEVGKSAIRALLYVIGAMVATALAWLAANGYIKG